MAERSPYAVSIDSLEAGVHVPLSETVESQSEAVAAHELRFVDTVIGADTKNPLG